MKGYTGRYCHTGSSAENSKKRKKRTSIKTKCNVQGHITSKDHPNNTWTAISMFNWSPEHH